jgi:hypothetical protein
MQQIWKAIRDRLGLGGGSARVVANARSLAPGLSPDLDFDLREDAEGRHFANWQARRIPRARVESLAADIDRLLAHLNDADAAIPSDTGLFRNPWGGKAHAIGDLQLGETMIDVNLSRRSGVMEIDVPIATSEQPLHLSPDDLARFAAAIRQMLALMDAPHA